MRPPVHFRAGCICGRLAVRPSCAGVRPPRDLVGRKYTFLITMSIMGRRHLRCRAFAELCLGWSCRADRVGRAPATARIGAGRRIRRRRDLCGRNMHRRGKRGFYTAGFRQPPRSGYSAALLVVIGTRTWLGEDAFKVWGWRIPFIRIGRAIGRVVMDPNAACRESGLREDERTWERPRRHRSRKRSESWSNLKIVLVSLAGAVMGQAVVWYAGQFYALFFLERTLRVDGATTNILTAIALVLATPGFVFFGWLSDKNRQKADHPHRLLAGDGDVFSIVRRAYPVRESGVVCGPSRGRR